MEFLVLGPFEVKSGGEPLSLGGPKPRAVLAELIVHLGSVVSADRLIDDLWGVAPPATADAVVQNAVSRLRKAIGASTIETVAPGYALRIDAGAVDAYRFERLVRDAMPLPALERSEALRDALALWRGPAYMDLAFESFLQSSISRLEELRLTALEDRLGAEIELGRHDAAIPELDALASREPSRERLRRLQMLALHRSGRTQDALDVYESLRREIDALSGLEPSTETKALQLMILRNDAAISSPSAAAPSRKVSRRSVAILVSDITLTPHADVDLEAEAAAIVATREAVRDAVVRHGGTFVPLLGSESVATFGAEVAREDDLSRAGRAGMEAGEILQSHGVPARFAIGVGRLLVQDGVPMLHGAVVDETRAAVAAALPGEVVLAASAAEAAASALSFRSSGGRLLLTSVQSVRPALATTSMLVGRSEALHRLDGAFHLAVQTRMPVHVLVSGEAGVGKTRLVDEFVRMARAVTLRASCVPYGEGITFLPLRALTEHAASLDATAPVVEDIPTTEEAFAHARGLVRHFAAAGPLIVVLDDLHWAVPTFLDLVEHLASASRGAVLIVTAARPELLAQRPSWATGAVELGPLSPSDSRLLVEECAKAVGLDEAVVSEIVETSDGFPLFVEQLVAFAREHRGSALSLPPSLDRVLAGRLDTLAAGQLTVLRHAAVLGIRFDRDGLAALADPSEEPGLDGRLVALSQTGLMRPLGGDDELGFVHTLVRDAAYAGITKAERVELHERAARYVDRAENPNDVAAAVHLEAAALLSREVGPTRPELEREAAHRLGAAGLLQWRGVDAPGAANILQRAMVLLERDDPFRLEVGVELGLVLRDLGDPQAAAAVLEETRRAARRLRRRSAELRVEVESIVLAASSGGAAAVEADALLDRALPVFRRTQDDRSLGRAFLVRAFLASIGCRFADSERDAEEALAALVRAGYAPSKALLVLAAATLHGSTPISAARVRCDELRERAQGHSVAQANVDLIRASIEVVGGDETRARALHEGAAGVFEEHGQRLMLHADCLGIEAEIEILAGDLERAAGLLDAAAAELERRGERGRAARHDALRADVLVTLSEPGRALKLVRRAAARTPRTDVHGQVTCLQIVGRALAASGNGAAGRRSVRRGLAKLEGTDAVELRARVLADLAEIETFAGTPDDVSAALARAEEVAAEKGSVLVERRLAALRAADPR